VRFEEALAELDSRQPSRMLPDLSRITALATMLDDPQLAYPSIHVTGTNGKTTTSRLITALACAHGMRTGLYTSPHLESATERISECLEPISEEEFAEQYGYLLPFLREVDARGECVTYFETLTALAYLWFADRPIALGVFEVGMGGEWDATNLVGGDVAVICPIALDHPELGPTIADKAREKAAIIKQGKVAVVREQPEEALGIVEERAQKVGARLLLEDRDFGLENRVPAVGGEIITVRGLHADYEETFLPMLGEHSARNAAAAVAAFEAFVDRPLGSAEMRRALGGTTSPGRLEVVACHPLVVLDGAHNPAGAQALAEALAESFSWDELVLVVAVSADKDFAGVLEALAPLADHVFATRYEGGRGLLPEDLADACLAAGMEVEQAHGMAQALDAAVAAAAEGDLVLVTGSLFGVAEARRLISAR